MKEKLYAIPVNDAFSNNCECPVCSMYTTLENAAIEYTMGPSYMEDDTRMQTDEQGFCPKHMEMIYASGNKLGISLILKTHFDKVINITAPLSTREISKKSLFGKAPATSIPIVDYLENLECSCFVCKRINNVFDRYINTIFYLWKTNNSFKEKYLSSNGFCNKHFMMLIKNAPLHIKGDALTEFNNSTKDLYIKNMERVRDDLAWFIDKFDYRNANEPWKNSKDAIPRAMTKSNGIISE